MCNGQIRIGEIYMMEFTGSDCEQKGWRPGVVFQNNVGNAFSPNIIALPLTTAIKKYSQRFGVTPDFTSIAQDHVKRRGLDKKNVDLGVNFKIRKIANQYSDDYKRWKRVYS